MVTKAKKALLASLAAFLCVMLTVFGLSMSVSLSETAKAADETTTEVAEVNSVKFATLAEAVNAVSDGGEIVVYSGVYTIPDVTYTGKSFTISAGVDQTVSFDMSVAHAIHGAKVSFNNVTFDYKTNNNYIGLQHADTLTYKGCTINGMVFLYATNETFNGCTFNQTSKDAYNVWTYGAKNDAFNQCVFNSAGKSVLVYNEGATPKTDLTVSETKFVASEKVDGKAAIEIDTSLMEGGTTITIDDKTTATDFAAGSNSGNTLWNDKKQTADTNKNTTITVADEVVYAPYVVAIGEVKYFSLTAAIAAAKAGDTVKLLADVEQNSQLSINKNITHDLNGKKIYNTKDIWGANTASVIAIRDGAEVTVMGDGTIAAKKDDCYTFNIIDGELTIENGTFIGNISVVQVQEGRLTINGGTFSLLQKMTDGKGEDRYLINCIDDAFTANIAQVAIYGGSFAGFDPNVSPEAKVDGKVPSYAAPGVGITKNVDGSFTAKANMAAQILDSDGNSVAAYATLEEAVNAAVDGQTVMLLTNVTISKQLKVYKAITLDLNGKTLTSEFKSDSGIYAIVVIGATLTNGTIQVENARAIGAYGAMIMDGVTVENGIIGGHATIGLSGAGSEYVIRNSTINGAYSVAVFAHNATVTIENSKITGRGPALYHNGSYYGLRLTVTDTTLTSAACSVYISGSASMKDRADNRNNADGYQQATFTRCKISGTNGIEVKYTNLTLNSCNISATVEKPTYEQNNNGSTASGFAVVSTDNATGGTTPAPKGTIAVSGEGNYVGAIGIGTLVKNKYEGFEDASYAVSGGKFNHAILPEYCADGFIPQDNGDGTFGVKVGTYVAAIGDNGYETLQAAFDTAKTGDTVKLLTDITLTAQVNITKALNGLTLDGNGKTITCATTTDVFTSGGSALYFGNATDKLYCTGIKIKDLTMTGKARFAIFLCGGTTTEFTNVNISGEYYIAVNLYGTHGATMTNCTISNSTIGTDEYISGVWSNVASANPLRLVSTTVDVIAINAYTTANTLAPKIFIDKNSSAEVHTFDDGSVSYNKKLCVSTESEGLYTVKEYFNSEWVDTYVAEVKGVKYETLQAAFDAAKAGNTVTLLANTKENVTIAKKLTLDLNGYTINGGTVKATPTILVSNCTVTITDSSKAKTGTVMREDTAENSGVSSHYVIDIQGKNGFLIVEGGNFVNNSGAGGTKGASLIRLGDDRVSAWPTLTIKGGTFTQDNFIVLKVDRGTLHFLGGTLNSAKSYAVENWNNAYIKGGTINGAVSSWVYSGGAAFSKLEISAGTINGDVESVSYDGSEDKQARVYITGGTVTGTLSNKVYSGSSEVTTAMATIEVTGGTFDIDPSKYITEAAVLDKTEDGKFGVKKVVLAEIVETGVQYYTMDEAFHAVNAGETIKLLRNYTTDKVQNSGSKSFTIDLGGFTWTYTRSDADCAAFEINYADVTLTVKNGKIISNTLVGLIPTAMSGKILYSGSSLVFEEVEMTAKGHSGIETNGGNENVNVTLTNCTLNVPDGFGIYFPSSGTLTINNSTITAKTMGVQVCSGELVISGDSEITVTGDAVTKTENDGAIEDGAAISIVNRPGYKGLSNIVITGGTFTAKAGNDAIKAYDWNNAEKTESAFTKADLVAVSGGTFSSEVKKDYLAKGYRLTKTGESYGVTAKYIKSTHVSLGTALSFSYKLRDLKEGETIKNAKASYRTVRGNLVEIDMTLVDGCYVFDGITPQMLDRKISVNVYIGDTVVYDVVDYSILDYLQDLLNTDLGTKATVTKQLVADLAFYGKAAMKYVGYTTTVVDKFIADNGLTQSTGEMTGVVTSSGTEKVANVSVQFASQNKILIGVAESVFKDYSYTIKVNGTEIDKALWQTDVVDGYRVYVSDGFAASYITDKDHYVEVEVLKNGASVQKVQCNVAGYCMKMAENAKMSELAKATYYYGVSAAKYANFKG